MLGTNLTPSKQEVEKMSSSELVFFVNGIKITEPNPDPASTLLQYLRRHLYLTGTKEGCGHGGCGSCTVMVSLYNHKIKRIRHYSVNACLFPLCAAHGLAITTVEGVGSTRTGLHEVQRRLIESHGLQCGFCTPGFVMSMFTLLRNDPTPSKDAVEQAIEGNLCRCTGYRSIVTAFQSFVGGECLLGENCCNKEKSAEGKDQTQLQGECSLGENCCKTDKSAKGNNETHGECLLGENCCKNEKSAEGKDQTQVSGPKSQKKPVPADSTQTAVFPAELKLSDKRRTETLTFKGSTYTWIEPTTLKDLLTFKQMYPDAPVVMGNSAVVFLIKSGGLKSTTLLYGKNIDELNDVQITKEGIRLGPALTFTDLRDSLRELSEKFADDKKRYFPAIFYLARRYGADQIRNVSTLGGSLVSSRSNYDLAPLLAAAGASIEITSVDMKRTVKYSGNLDLAPEEIVTSIILPYSTEDEYLEFFKVAERRTFSLCTGNGALCVKFLKGRNTVESLRLCFGGIGNSMIIASKTAEKARGREFNEVLLSDLLSSISEELHGKVAEAKSDSDYHLKLASGFLFKFYISILSQRNIWTPEETRSALEPLTKTPYASTQVYEQVPADQKQTDAVGRPVPNVSSQGVVTGEAVYVDDMPKLENELFLGLVTSSRGHATIVDVDVSKALHMPGVRGFIDHTDVPGDNLWGPTFPDEEVFASKEVTYVGCTIGAVVADTREQAMLAAKAVNINYKDLDAVVSIQDAIEKESFYPVQEELVAGDVIEGFRESDHVIDGEFETGRQEHFYMETQSTIAVPRTENNELEVFVATQNLATTQSSLSKILHVPSNKIVVRTKRLGGSFGGKGASHFHAAGPAVVAAYKLRRPIRCILSREDDMLMTGKRHAYHVKYKVGFDKSGKIKAVEAQLYSDGGHSLDYSPLVLEHTMISFESTYKIPNLKLNGRICKTNTATGTAMRGFGTVQAALMIEEIIFRISIALQVSQAQVRHANLLKEGDVLSYGMSLTNCTIGECWDKCAKDSKYETRVETVQQFNKQNRWKKRGMTMTSCRFGIGFPKIFLMQGAALVHIYLDGSILITTGGVEMGQGLNTKLIQVASRALEAPMEKIFINETSTHTVPNAIVTGGSTGTDIFGPAVIDACTKLNERLAPFKDKIPDGNWERWVLAAYFERVQLSVTGFYKHKKDADFDLKEKTSQPCDYFTYGVACSEVEIDCLTGESQVLQTDIVMDVGKSLNPTIDIGQIEGAFIQGLGMMTSEKVVIAEDGRMVNCSPLSYKIPNVSGIPRKFNVTLLKNENAVTHLYSSKGIGEPPLLLATSVFMAIKAAIQEARKEIGLSGYFRLDCPATVEQIRLACGDQLVKSRK